MEELAFITLTNDGYFDYTLNLLKSLEVYNLEKKLKMLLYWRRLL